jgi:MraZ protein
VEISGKGLMMSRGKFFFSGSVETKLDDKNRFVLPQSMRYGLVEEGVLEFTIALGLGGSLAIYRRSDIDEIVQKFQAKQHVARYQKFFTLFFSTLYHTSCDKLGRVLLPPLLRKAIGIKSEIVVAGVLNKIEIWPKEKYEKDLRMFLEGKGEDSALCKMTEEAFALLGERDDPLACLTEKEQEEYQEI